MITKTEVTAEEIITAWQIDAHVPISNYPNDRFRLKRAIAAALDEARTQGAPPNADRERAERLRELLQGRDHEGVTTVPTEYLWDYVRLLEARTQSAPVAGVSVQDKKILAAGFDHPCKNTCSGWRQGFERGQMSAAPATSDAAQGEREPSDDKLRQLAKENAQLICDQSNGAYPYVEGMSDLLFSMCDGVRRAAWQASAARTAPACVKAPSVIAELDKRIELGKTAKNVEDALFKFACWYSEHLNGLEREGEE